MQHKQTQHTADITHNNKNPREKHTTHTDTPPMLTPVQKQDNRTNTQYNNNKQTTDHRHNKQTLMLILENTQP